VHLKAFFVVLLSKQIIGRLSADADCQMADTDYWQTSRLARRLQVGAIIFWQLEPAS